MDCDYLCDGTDDQVEIQAAIDALSGKGSIRFLKGTFMISSPIILNNLTLKIEGQGNATILKPTIDNDKVFTLAGTLKVIFSYFSIIGTTKNTDIGLYGANNSINEDSNIYVDHLDISNVLYAIKLISSYIRGYTCSVCNCYIHDSTNGIWIEKRSTIVNNYLINVSNYGITSNGIICNNIILDSVHVAIQLHFGYVQNQPSSIVCGNYLSVNSHTAILITLNGCIVLNNYIYNYHSAASAITTMGTCIMLSGGISGNNLIMYQSHTLILGNVINTNGNSHGIQLSSCNYCAIYNNLISSGSSSNDAASLNTWNNNAYPIFLYETKNTKNNISYNYLLGKNYISQGGTNNTFRYNDYVT